MPWSYHFLAHPYTVWDWQLKSYSQPGGWFNINMSSYQYRKYHFGDKTILRSSYLHNGISYTVKMTSLYWIRALAHPAFTALPRNHIDIVAWKKYGDSAKPITSWLVSASHECIYMESHSINRLVHNNDIIMGVMTSQITSLTIVYSTVYSGTEQRKHQSSASLAFVRGIHHSPVNSQHKRPVTQRAKHCYKNNIQKNHDKNGCNLRNRDWNS